jgi:thiol-disulfide isomerase/thioredoxin
MNELKMWWKKGWLKNVVFLAILGIVFFTDAGQWLRVQVTGLTLRNPSNGVEVVSAESVYTFPMELIAENGDEHMLSEFQGDYVFVNFWASWCVPCLAEMSSLETFTAEFPEMTFLFITREAQNEFDQYMSETPYELDFYKQGSKTPSQLEHSAIPASFLLDKEGRIVYQHFGAADWGDDEVVSEIRALIKG